jgi:Tol biopolymer transport system component
MEPDGANVTRELTGVTHARQLSWSPEGDWLAFIGDMRGQTQVGWLYNTRTNQVRQFTDDYVEWLAWSPDGTEIAAIRNVGGPAATPQRDLVTYEVTEIVS